jgi:phosphoenolpyruvate synthase/pyruvate phosphate dikinase
VDRATGAVTERRLGDKAVMTVRTSDGTREVPVPAERRSASVLTDAQAGELARLGVRVEGLYDRPMDIEWARHDGTVFIVQARPVTAL